MNTKTQTVALLSEYMKASYHLFSYPDCKLLRKAPWKSIYQSKVCFTTTLFFKLFHVLFILPDKIDCNLILSFNYDGDKITALDVYGNFSISSTSNDKLLFSKKVGEVGIGCRWDPTSPLITLVPQVREINVFDPLKRAMVLTANQEIHQSCMKPKKKNL